TFNFRADGSSKFRNKPWGFFPSFALAWRISQESFLRDYAPLNDLKIRFGWGRVGNDNIGNDAFVLNMFNTGPTFVDYVLGNPQALANGATVLTWINQGGHWENTEQWSVGVDFSWFNNKLTGSIDGFIRNTNDMLMSVTAPAQVGNRYSATANVGKVRNRGIEISLEHRNTVNRDFHYSVSGNISFIDNKLTALNGGSPIYTNYSSVQVVDQGYPLYYFWGYDYQGIYRSQEEIDAYLPNSPGVFQVGDAKYRDVNGDGKINDQDRIELGSSIPWLNYGLNLGAWWKDFDLQLFFQGVGGNKIYNQMRHRLEGNGSNSVLSPVMANAWTVDNQDGTIPNPKNSVNYYVSNRFLESGAYFRL
ncbi:MAG: TonB-dependent receptor, partial [Muribaculaceae bacterium]|nr:TonB-dependent receptor [Muribaculaceae bacterium]